MQKYKDKIKIIFAKNREIACPAFEGETIVLNAKGINHLLYKGNRSKRSKSRIRANVRLLPRAIKLLNKATFWQEESSYKQNGTICRFWAFEAVVDKRRIKVIVRQVGNGRKYFWSVIPAWRRDRFGIVNARKRNLEE